MTKDRKVENTKLPVSGGFGLLRDFFDLRIEEIAVIALGVEAAPAAGRGGGGVVAVVVQLLRGGRRRH